MAKSLQFIQHDRGYVLSASGAQDHPVAATIPRSLLTSGSRLAHTAGALVASLGTLPSIVNGYASRLQEEAFNAEIGPVLARALRAPLHDFQKEGRDEQRNAAEARARGSEIPAGNPMLRSEIRQHLRTRPIGEQAAMLAAADRETLAALLEGGQGVSGLPDDVYRAAERRYMILNHIELTGLQGRYGRQPNATDPLAAGPDREAAYAAAEAAMVAHEQRAAVINDARTAISGLIDVVAATADLSRDDSYKLLFADSDA